MSSCRRSRCAAAREYGSRISTAAATSTRSAPGGSTCSATRNPRINCRHHRAAGAVRACDARRLHPRAGDRAGRGAGAITPPGLTRCFFADNGSAAIEVALKMSFHYWQNQGQPRKRRFVTLSNAYHGETLGALAVGNVELYKSTYAPLLMDVLTVPSPDCYGREPGDELGRAHAAQVRAHADRARALRRGYCRGNHRAAGAMRRRHAHVRSGLSVAAARRLRSLRRASDRR